MFRILLILFFGLQSFNILAADYSARAKIIAFRAHNAAVWSSDTWIQLEGVKGKPGCYDGTESGTPLTYMAIPASEAILYSFALSTYIAGKSVEVYFTSDTLIHGMCSVKYITSF